jgi:hypothetical protein
MVTPILIDGFEHQVLAAGVAFGGNGGVGIWESTGGTAPTYTAGRNGMCLDCAGNVAASQISKRWSSDPSVIVVSIYVRQVSSSQQFTFIFCTTTLFSGAARFYANADGSITGQVGGTTQVSTGVNLFDALWHRLDFRSDLSADPWTLDWQVDGSPQTSISAANTAQQHRYMKLGNEDGNKTFEVQYDDLVVSATAGDYPLGPHDVLYGVPNGDGTHNAGTNTIEDQAGTDIVSPNAFPLLDEWPPNNTDYIKQSTIGAGNYAEVTFADQPGGKTIWGVMGYAALLSSGLNANSATTRVVDSAGTTLTDIYSGDMSETVINYRTAMITAPGSGWDGAGYQGVKARVGFATDVIDVPEWTALMLQYAVTDAAVGGTVVNPMGMAGFFGG